MKGKREKKGQQREIDKERERERGHCCMCDATSNQRKSLG